jgi:hypothetical protein
MLHPVLRFLLGRPLRYGDTNLSVTRRIENWLLCWPPEVADPAVVVATAIIDAAPEGHFRTLAAATHWADTLAPWPPALLELIGPAAQRPECTHGCAGCGPHVVAGVAFVFVPAPQRAHPPKMTPELERIARALIDDFDFDAISGWADLTDDDRQRIRAWRRLCIDHRFVRIGGKVRGTRRRSMGQPEVAELLGVTVRSIAGAKRWAAYLQATPTR